MLGRLVATLTVVACMSGLSTQAALAENIDSAPFATCYGLTCTEPGHLKPAVVADTGSAPSVSSPHRLESQTRSGYYEFGRALDIGRQVAYVLKPGDVAPPEIRALAAFQGIEAGDFGRSTVVFFGDGAALTVPQWEVGKHVTDARMASIRTKARAAKKTKKAHASDIDAYNCGTSTSSLWFCIYENDSYGGRRLQFQDAGTWQSLSSWSFNDLASSMRNRRDYESILTENGDHSGYEYCALPHTVDSSFSNNGFNDKASALYNTSTWTGYSPGCSNG